MLSFIITCFSFLLSRFSYFFSFITKEESVAAETDEKPSENVVVAKSIPECSLLLSHAFLFFYHVFHISLSFITKEESVEAETDEKPSENVVATKSIPESTDVTSTT